jgi:HEAT repeat protein
VNRRLLWLVLGGVLLAGAAGLLLWRGRGERAPASAGTSPADSLRALLADTSWMVRMAAANQLPDRQDIPLEQRAKLAVATLDREIARPTVARIIPGSWPPFTNFLRLGYLAALERLGPPAAATVRSATRSWKGEAGEWGSLARAASGDPVAAPELRKLVTESADTDVRMTAARHLGMLRDREAIPALTRALEDTAVAQPVSDMPGRPTMRFYPVRVHAGVALEALGVSVTRTGDRITVR